MTEQDLDRERIEKLCKDMFYSIRENYIKGPISRERVYEALNALAFCSAWIIRSVDDPKALEWFKTAFNNNLQDSEESSESLR